MKAEMNELLTSAERSVIRKLSTPQKIQDYLESLPFVDAKPGFGTIGHSLGRHNSVYTAVFDERIKVVVTSCGFDSFRDYMDGDPAVWRPERGWCQTRYMPALAAYAGRLDQLPFDFPDVLSAIAPRALFVNAPLHDDNFRWRSVDQVVESVRSRYAAAGVADRLVVHHPDSKHRFPPEERRAAYEFMERNVNSPVPPRPAKLSSHPHLPQRL